MLLNIAPFTFVLNFVAATPRERTGRGAASIRRRRQLVDPGGIQGAPLAAGKGCVPFIRPFLLSLVLSFIRSFVLSFFHSFFRSFVLSFFRSFVLSFIRSFVLSFIRSFVLSFFRSFVLSLSLSFVHSWLFDHRVPGTHLL